MTGPNWAPKTIWTGDNLPILRGMNSDAVDLIYADPPFNSKANYAAPIGSKAAGAEFKDTWSLSDVDAEWINLIEAKHPRVYRVLLAAMTDGDKSYLAYMAARLLECQRVLKPTGSIYLHCDPTMSHYLKLLMDAIFGRQAFRSEVTWKRTNTHNDSRHTFPNVADAILFYAGPDASFAPVYEPHSADYVAKFYRHDDDDGRGPYRLDNMASPNPRPMMMYEWKGYAPPVKGWRYQESRMRELDAEGRIYYPAHADGSPDYSKRLALKRYLREQKGAVVGNVWSDIQPLSHAAKERVGYPTQKPLALLRRVIAASCPPGGLVLDPFCGCATTCVAADDLGRNWAGIDISPKAAELVVHRIADRQGLFRDIVHRRDIPKRSDLGRLPKPSEHRATLYGLQAGHCNGCAAHFELRHLEVDHIIARANGGTDHLDNLQLLCGNCNRVKGDRGMAYLRVRLQL